MSLDLSDKEPSAKKQQQQREEVDLLIRLDPEDVEIQDIGVDDAKLKVNVDVLNENPTPKEEVVVKKPADTAAVALKNSNFLWVSNVTRDIKAADLKSLFAQTGKVLSVKILTNGDNLYGYVSMDCAELADKCVSVYNDTLFRGKKIQVSKNRPDISRKSKPKSKSAKKPDAAVEPTTKTEEDPDKDADKLRSKLDTMYQAKCKLQRRYDGLQHDYDTLNIKYENLKADLKKLKAENRDERRRLNLDKENFEKLKKIEESRLDLDRTTLNKELSETRKLKDSLKAKIDEIRYQKGNKRTRSYSPRNRSPQGDAGRSDKKFKRSDNYSRVKTPSPPNLNSDASKRVGNVASIPNRQPYYAENYACRQTNAYANAHWIGAYQKDQRRAIPNQPSTFQRYNGPPVTHGASSIVVPPRNGNYYQHW